MSDRYTINFTVLGDKSKAGLSGVDLLHDVRTVVRDWIKAGFLGQLGDEGSGYWVGPDETLKLEVDSIGDAGYFVAEWEHPDRDLKQFRWRVSIQASTEGVATTFRANIQMVDSSTAITPDRRPVDRPRLIPNMIERFECRFDTYPLSVTAAHVRMDNATNFIRDVILGAERNLPIIVLSRTAVGATALLPDRLQNRLAGLATVAVFEPEATWELTYQLGRHLACFDGAVRVYWPGCQPDDPPYRHRRWLFEQAQLLERRLSDTLLHVLTTQFPRYAGQTTIERVVRDIRRSRLHELDTEFRSLPSYGQIPTELLERIEAALKGRDKTLEGLQFEIEMRDETIREQTAELDTHRKNYRDTSTVANPSDPEIPESQIDTVAVAVLSAADHLTRLRFLDSAFASADDSPYEHPEKIYAALVEMNELAVLRAAGQPLGMDIVQYLEEKGIDYTAQESQITQSKFGDERDFRDGARKWLMTAHVRFGNAVDPRYCARIYVDWDDSQKEWVIGHVGKHLTNTKS